MPWDHRVRHVSHEVEFLLTRHAMRQSVIEMDPVVNSVDVVERGVQRFQVWIVFEAAWRRGSRQPLIESSAFDHHLTLHHLVILPTCLNLKCQPIHILPVRDAMYLSPLLG